MDTEALKKSLLKKFQEVTADRLQKIQLGVLDLEKETADQAADDVARELHTMKGEARMLGLAAIGQLAHAAEDVLRAEREGRTATEIATDVMRPMAEVSGQAAPVIHGSKPKPPPPVAAPVVTAPPPVAAPRPAPVEAPAAAHPPARGGEEEAPSAAKSAIADRTIRVNVEVLDSLGLLAGDLLVESARGRLRSSETEALFERFSRLGDRFLRLAEQVELPNEVRTVLDRVESDLHMLRDDAFRFVRRNDDGINILHGNLAKMADHVAEARLVPLSTVFDAFPRAVRDMARTQTKEVDLVIENADIGVDRSMLADVRDALVHLLRNAVDHGLESPDTRQQLGKPLTGRVRIRVRVDGDMLHIEVEDDGRGIDPERLRQVAVNKRLINAVQAAALSERE